MDSKEWIYPILGGKISVPLQSIDGRERFALTAVRGNINLVKGSYQNLYGGATALVRLCFNGAPHRNPDGVEIGANHLHIYREGFGYKWAWPAPEAHFTNIDDLWLTFEEFMRYCNITDPPNIRRGLFT